jgi:hypothetical protein
VLIGDATLLALVVWSRPLRAPITRAQLGGFVALAAMGVAVAFGVPPRADIEHASEATPAVTELSNKGSGEATPPVKTTPPPVDTTPSTTPAQPATQPAASAAWPSAPTKLQPYYLPQFEQWVGKRLREQPVAALITRPIPADLEQGRWVVMFFREDCEHCHAVLDRHFSPKVPMRTLLVTVPDADPAAALPNPCGECTIRSLPKGPDWVIGTPVLLSLKDGVVQGVVSGTDAEDPAKVQSLIDGK